VIRTLSFALVLAWIAPAPALADDPTPQPAQPPPTTTAPAPAQPTLPAQPTQQPAPPQAQPQPAKPTPAPAQPAPAQPTQQPQPAKPAPTPAPTPTPAAPTPTPTPARPAPQPAPAQQPQPTPAQQPQPAPAQQPQPAPTQQPQPAPAQPAPPPPPPPPQSNLPPPTPEQLESAKKAFGEGKKLHSQGKYAEAIEKFKESYRLSRNPLLLYNIGFTMDEAKEADMALYYYRKFLREAPQDAEQRPAVAERVKVLEQQFNPNGAQPEQVASAPSARPAGPRGPIVIKPPGTYNATDFEHQVIETAPPARPLDLTAFVPEDSGFIVTLFYRTAGEGKYQSKMMKWRYRELVARIPAPKMIGTAVQYYIEVKDTTGAVVTRSGKSTSPNLIHLEAGATPSFYPDLTDEGEALSATEIRKRDDEDDPLNRGKKRAPEPDEIAPAAPPEPRDGFRDVGSQKFYYAKWGSTGAALGLGGLSLVFYIQAVNYARKIREDVRECPGSTPCREFDAFAAGLQATGQRYQMLSQIAFGAGIAATGVASYFWIREYRAKRRGELKVSSKTAPPPVASWTVAPVIGPPADGFVGAAAARRF
jgi:tetratricopeptide (TPR) repeat protein